MEKMLVTEALDERDLLKKRIKDAISKGNFIGLRVANSDKVADINMTVEEFKDKSKSTLQSIQDLIKRYKAIDVAITASNATESITTKSGKTMTRAAGIALRKSINNSMGASDTDFECMLITRLSSLYQNALLTLTKENKRVANQAENMLQSIVTKTSSDLKQQNFDSEKAVVDAFIKNNTIELVDSIGLADKIQQMSDEYNALVSELETAIKVSNATTYIEIN